MNDRPSVFWDDHNRDIQDVRLRITYGYYRRRIQVADWLVNLSRSVRAWRS